MSSKNLLFHNLPLIRIENKLIVLRISLAFHEFSVTGHKIGNRNWALTLDCHSSTTDIFDVYHRNRYCQHNGDVNNSKFAEIIQWLYTNLILICPFLNHFWSYIHSTSAFFDFHSWFPVQKTPLRIPAQTANVNSFSTSNGHKKSHIKRAASFFDHSKPNLLGKFSVKSVKNSIKIVLNCQTKVQRTKILC